MPNKRKLSKERNCIKCLYHKGKDCKVDGHNIMIDLLRAYSCKYYKELYIIKEDDNFE